MDDIRHFRQTDYTRYVRRRGPSAGALSQAPPKPADSDTMTISLRLSLPDYSRWKIYVFVRQYPYISLAIAAVAFIGLVLAGDALSWLWHIVHNRGVRG